MALIIIFIAALAIGIPVAFVLAAVGTVHLWMIDPGYLLQLPQRIFVTASNYNLMAIPMFILAGDLMGLAGDVDRLLRFSRSLVGRIKGGTAYVMVVFGFLLGGPLGSANAEAAMLATTMYPKMKEEGYKDSFLAGLISSISVCGPLVPPGMLMVIYGVASGASIKELFLAGIMPAVYLAVALSIVIFLTGRKQNWAVTEFSGWGEVWTSFRGAFISLAVPVLVLLFIAIGVCTPTEAAAVMAVLFLLNGMFNYKTVKIKDLYELFLKAGTLSGAILIISAMGGVFGWTLAFDQVPQKVAAGMLDFTQNPYAVLLIINVLVLLFGMIMDATPAVMILVPVLMPLVAQMHYDPVHFGMMICFNLTIGLMHPPIGTVLYTTSITTGVEINTLYKTIWPWVGVCVVVLLIVAYVPDTIMWIPELFRR
ncbi:MAG TPA: TRAP transporter large permease [Anaerovoracaceae bacterium]|nr:TRAP transporter large permease [Anaerovoracaceae bacterium]